MSIDTATYFVACDIQPSPSSTWNRCRLTESQVYTASQVQAYYTPVELSITDAQALTPHIILVFAIAWTFRALSKFLENR